MDKGQNDACCRLANARLASENPRRFCPFAAHHGGGMCGTFCQGYCNLALAPNICSITQSGGRGSTTTQRYFVLNKQIDNMALCERVCNMYPTTGRPGDGNGNSVHCRTQHLVKAAGGTSGGRGARESIEQMCMGATPHGGDKCGSICEG